MADNHTQQAKSSESPSQPETAPLQTPENDAAHLAWLRATSGAPPAKPNPRHVLWLQRQIGNRATLNHLRVTPARPGTIQREIVRVVEQEVTLPINPDTLTLEQLREMLLQHPVIRHRMMARTDDLEHAGDVLNDHSNLQQIWERIEVARTQRRLTPSLRLHLTFNYENSPGATTQRVHDIELSLPDLPDLPDPVPAPVPAEPDTLTDDELAYARTFYRTTDNPDAISRLKLTWMPDTDPATAGRMDDDLIRAIADWQTQHTPGNVDGIISDRQMYEIAAFGLERRSERTAYVDAIIREVEPRWASMSPAERLAAVMGRVNARLEASGIPPIGYGVASASAVGAGFGGQLDKPNWRLELTAHQLNAGIEWVVMTGYHEARHAEQTFYAIRFMAEVAPAEAVMRSTAGGINSGVFARAIAANASSPMTPAQRDLARQWYEQNFTNMALTQAINDEVSAAQTAVDALEGSTDTEAIARAQARLDRANAAYHALVGETDAYRSGNAVARDFQSRRRTPTP